EGRAVYAPFPAPEADRLLADAGLPKWVHDAKELRSAAVRSGRPVDGVVFDTLLAGYLLDPAEATYELDALCRTYLGADVLAGVEEQEPTGQLFGTPWRPVAAEAAAVALLAPVMEKRIDRAGLRYLLEEVELPLAAARSSMPARGVARDAP